MTNDQATRLILAAIGGTVEARLAAANLPTRTLDATDPLVGWDRYYVVYKRDVEMAARELLAAMAAALEPIDPMGAYDVRRLDESMARNTVAIARPELRAELEAKAAAMAATFPAVSEFLGRLLDLGVIVGPSPAESILGREAVEADLVEADARVARMAAVEVLMAAADEWHAERERRYGQAVNGLIIPAYDLATALPTIEQVMGVLEA